MSAPIRIELMGLGPVEVPAGRSLISALAAHGVEFPCGGSGVCGGCRVRVVEGALAETATDRRYFTESELSAGWRLACAARPEASLRLELCQWQTPVLTDDYVYASAKVGLGIAVDVGTTTVAAQLVELRTGRVLAVRTSLNPQVPYAADIISRVRLARESSSELTSTIRQCIGRIVTDLSRGRESEVGEVVLVGNTVMHHLFCGLDVEPLSHVPFHSQTLQEQQLTPKQLGWPLPPGISVRFLRCLGGFVGSDILAGIAAVGLHASRELIALVDLGTNGEIVVGNCERILCASTAAGPAFEAASISCGMRASIGAIYKVALQSGALHCDVIGNVPARGICGSGLVDAVAAGVREGIILPSGRFANSHQALVLSESVSLNQADIRELQLAKGAIAAGIRILLRRWNADFADLTTVYLSGAFGNYIRAESAARIGLLEMDAQKVVAAGNTALRGAKLLLSTGEPVIAPIEHVPLASQPGFQDTFVGALAFPKE